ncbi:MAG: 3-keto-5-aminohexanoate cleavage protein [Gammaproteobacteria bacterium]
MANATGGTADVPLIIEAAVNGMTPKARNPRVPVSAQEIAADALACLDAGAAIVHTHAPDLTAGVEETVAHYAAAWTPVLAQLPQALFYATFRNFRAAADRSAHIWRLARQGLTRISYIDTGSTNVGHADDEGLPAGASVYENTYDDCRYMMDACARLGLGPSIAVFEPGFLRVVLAYHRAGRLPAGAMIKFYFGGDHNLFTGARTPITFGLPPTLASLDAYLAMLGDAPIPWAVAVVGGDVTRSPVAAAAVARGGHLRLGLEDLAGDRQPSNAELVAEAVALARAAGRRIATPAESVRVLGLP